VAEALSCKLGKALLRRFEDKSEACREAAVSTFKAMLQVGCTTTLIVCRIVHGLQLWYTCCAAPKVYIQLTCFCTNVICTVESVVLLAVTVLCSAGMLPASPTLQQWIHCSITPPFTAFTFLLCRLGQMLHLDYCHMLCLC
jgi:hypothetical protein